MLTRAQLVVEVVRTYRQVRSHLRTDDLPSTLDALRAPVAASGVTLDEASYLAHAVVRTLIALPADSRCLMRSLVLTSMLARRGADPRVVIAVRPGEAFGAHAWVELDGQPLLSPGSRDYARLVEL